MELLLFTIYACAKAYCYQIDEVYHNTEAQCNMQVDRTYEPYATEYMCVSVFRTKSYILSLPKPKELPQTP